MLQSIKEKQQRVQQRKTENEDEAMIHFRIRNEEEALKLKERQQKKLREKKRLEIKKKNVLDKIAKHEEIIAVKRS